MSWLSRGLGSSVGLKFLAAISGLFLLLFVIGHMLGNLQVFIGPEQLNAYAAKLQGLGPGLWVIRFGLLAIFVLHVFVVAKLQTDNWKARPVGYDHLKPLKSTTASRTMIWSGLLIFAFVTYHLLHFTVKSTHMALHQEVDGMPDVYGMVIHGFQQAPVAIAYIVAMVILFFHLKHGIASLFQSLGWNAPKYRVFTERLGLGVAALILIGNVSMPLLILLGIVGGGE